MGCGCNDGGSAGAGSPAGGGWQQVPELRLLRTPLVPDGSAPPRSMQPGRAPTPVEDQELPWWVWFAIGVIGVRLLRGPA
jgi:hypothetical protein